MHIEKDFKNKLTKKDYILYLLSRNILLLLSPVIIASLIVAIIFSIINDGFTMSTIIYILPILLFILTYFQMFKVINHTIKSHEQISELKIILTDTEYIDITNGEKNSLSYEKFYCYKETKNYLYMFVDRNNAIIVPKREFNNDELTQIKNKFSSSIKKQSIYDFSSWITIALVVFLVALILNNLIL
jgi:hypothetical protein